MKTITRDEYEIDLSNTEKEFKAYNMLVEGFKILATMPENDPKEADHCRHLAKHYSGLADRCHNFLLKLQKLSGGNFPLCVPTPSNEALIPEDYS